LSLLCAGLARFFALTPHPLSHRVGEGCRGARRCALMRVPPRPLAGEGDKGGEGNTAPLPQRFCAEPKFTKVRINENPLLKVPPARRGNRVGAPLTVPLAKRGEPKGGGKFELWTHDWYQRRQGGEG